MRPLAFALIFGLAATSARADLATATFEDRYPGSNAVNLDFRPSDSFASGGFTFSNHYTPPGGGFGGYYSGFGVSSRVDNTLVNDPLGSSDFDHAYAAYAPAGAGGTGSGGSATYAVAFNYGVGDAVIDLPAGFAPQSIDVANTTYAASAIRFGDAYSRPFAAGDYFRLDIIGFAGAGATGAQVGIVPWYLADYRGPTPMLLDQFTEVKLGPLAGARSLAFLLDTNVKNTLGPSVPFTFAVDRVVGINGAVPEPSSLVLVAVGALALGAAARRRGARVAG